jgi:transcriptional regulator GlxA family with amidase domain
VILTQYFIYFCSVKNVSILIPERAIVEPIAGTFYMLKVVNQFLQTTGKEPFFNVQMVGLTKEVKLENSLFSIHTEKLLKDVKKTDLIFIPSLSGDLKTAIKANKKVLPWIIDQYRNGAEVASICVGSFLLASTGLLKGKKCSTHWGAANEFRSMFPDVELVDGAIITDELGIYSSGAANSYWNLLLYLIEKNIDRNTAIIASKLFAVDIDRNSQSVFILFDGQKNHGDDAILNIQKFIEGNLQTKITVADLAKKAAIGKRSFERRFKNATNNTVGEYVQRIKIEAAKKSFENSRRRVNEVMFEVGYSDRKTFRIIFKQITGLTPIEYQRKYNKRPQPT